VPVGENGYVYVSQQDKFVRRIFSNGVFDEGGRYYGGWWQRIPSETRERIQIWGRRTAEIDYSGLHIVLLYSMEGVDYWKVINRDPYVLEGYELSDRMRGLLKRILLIAINAKTKIKAVMAVRELIFRDQENYGWFRQQGYKIEKIIDDFSDSHGPIRDYFFSGKGIWLQRIDSMIAERIINEFTQKGIPILCIHDSFISDVDHILLLQDSMETAFKEIVKELGEAPEAIKVAGVGLEFSKWYRRLKEDPEDQQAQLAQILIQVRKKDNHEKEEKRIQKFRREVPDEYYYVEA